MAAFSVQQSIEIQASPRQVYDLVRNFRRWPEWSPWIIVEPDCSLEFSEDGMSYSWNGEVIGSGGMRIANDEPGERIEYDLRFLKPFKSQADVAFRLLEKDGGTEVVWSMQSALPFFLFFLKKQMVAMIGSDYDRGLLMMKALLEEGKVPSKLAFGLDSHDASITVGVRSSCPVSHVGVSMERDLARVAAWLGESAAEPVGRPRSFYHRWDMVNQTAEYTIGIPVGEVPGSLPAGFVVVETPALETYRVIHEGPYPFLGNAWSAGMMRGRSGVFKQDRTVSPFEIYENDPAGTDPKDLVTSVHFPKR